jgi:hypothetical protein
MPGVEHLLCIIKHGLAVSGDPLAQKGRLRKPSLSQPEFAVATHQAVSQQESIQAQPKMLSEILAIGYQDLLNKIRMANQHALTWPEPESNDVAVFASTPGKKLQPATGKFG